jgi:N-acetyl-gamma-glutamyl-phosphate reductase common form
VYPDLKFSSLAEITEIVAQTPNLAILAAAPHGLTAGLIDHILTVAESKKTGARVFDISADYRYADAGAYEAVYKHAHGAPHRLAQFTCAVPEHLAKANTQHIGHPGCFATAALLAVVPLLKLDLVESQLFLTGVTGSSGSGRTPSPGTHHPHRQSDLYAYNALGHRHAPEVATLAKAASGVDATMNFIPHSGPFVRGIHMTVQAVAKRPIKTNDLLAALSDFYRGSHFVRVSNEMPHVKDIAGSNYALMSGAANGQTVAVMCVLDNLVKGAAGGAIQWLNRVYDFEETTGLTAPAAGWT